VSAAASVRPFPWGSLARTSRAEAHAVRLVRAWARGNADLARMPAVLGEMLGAVVDARVRAAGPVTEARGLGDGAGVLLARAEEPQVERAVLVEVEPALLAAALRLAVKRPGAFAFDPASPLSPGAIGGFAAIVAAAARRSHGGAALRVLAAGPAPALEADLVRTGGELSAVTLTVLLAHDAFEARVVVPRSAVLAAPSPPWDAAALNALGATPLALPVVACAVRLPVAEVARLGVGDVLLVSSWPLSCAQTGHALTGPVLLSAPAAEVGFRAELGEDGRLVLRGHLEPLCPAEANMGDGVDGGELIDAVGDVPVLVRVEIGEAQMAAREWAAFGRGDVLALGRRVGEPVILRVGGVVVARGDLVELEGEVGVRIVERLAPDGAAR
jgi:flagellar motor switch/type III secretory pathway protein FliN